MEWLEAQPLGDASGGQGWFAHLSLIHPHPPFVAPAPYNDMYAPEEGDAFLTAEASVMAHPVAQMMADKPLSDFVPGMQGRLTDASEEDLRRIRSVYYGLITEVDAQLGRLFDHLKALGEWDNTIIIMTSDHGEMMGDYGLMGKGGFFPESQHIPLIIRVPGLPEGQVCSEYTSAIDLFPTLLGLQGAEAYNSLDGCDLGPVLRGNTEQTGHDAAVWEFDFRGDIGLSAPSADDLAASHIQVRAQGDAVFVASPRGGPLLLDVSGRAGQTVDRAQDQAALPDVLQATQALLQFRMMHMDQTLTNIRLGGNGPRSLLDQ
jgi:arylsulfatase A-like enzyme